MAKAIIGGLEVDSDSKVPIINPATGDKVDEVPKLGIEQVRYAIEEAERAQVELEAMPASERAKALIKTSQAIRDHADEISRITALEIGRPIKSSRADVVRAASIFELAASELKSALEGKFIPLEVYEYPSGNDHRIALTKRQPLGVVASITPFNFPAASFAHKLAPALAVGNSVVHKPTIYAPLTQLAMAKLIAPNFPKGSLNVITGDSRAIGDEFISNEKISLITFTGSESVGLSLAARAVSAGKRVIMELGGSDAEIVFEDADMDSAASAALTGRFDYAGQFCNATKRLLVQKNVKEEFLKSIRQKMRSLKVGDPLSEDTSIGPLINADAVDRMKLFLDDALQKGAKIIEKLATPNTGFFFPPTLIDDVSPSMKVLTEEVFGPILPVYYFSDDDEAVNVVNSTKYGLDASIFTRDFARAYLIADRVKAGSIVINDTTRLRWDNLPFGGMKKSGIGRESVRDTMLEMTESKLLVYKIRNKKLNARIKP
ncbi:MAG: aldehyde dehydrogenase family protein [Thermoprotei archaeon]